jgi:hypothetical protein
MKYEKNIEILQAERPERLATFLNITIKKILDEIEISEDIYNGRCKVVCTNKMFMNCVYL